MACSAHIVKSRPLKRVKYGAPDVYPQLSDQREDDLSDIHLKKGFSNAPVTQHECGSAREMIFKIKGLSALKNNICSSANDIALEKQRVNTLQDNGTRRIQTIQRDQFWTVNPRSNRLHIKNFWKDLSNYNEKTLGALVKGRIPSFQKKEEILDNLADNQVPLVRAVWFMKITAAYISSISKKRQVWSVPAIEWTRDICNYLKENLCKFAEQQSVQKFGTGNRIGLEIDAAHNHWVYCLRLCNYMYQEGLLDKQEFLMYIIKWVKELKIGEKEDMLRHLIQVMLTYFDDVVLNFTVARAAAYMCVAKLNALAEVKSVKSTFEQDITVKDCYVPARSSCPYLDALLLTFSTVLQRITLLCPTALIWQRHWVQEEGGIVHTNESPLDLLPCHPSSLPFPRATPTEEVRQVREELIDNEEDAKVRSVMAEENWLMGEDNAPPSVLPMLTTLDDHLFSSAQVGGSVAALHKKVFGSVTKSFNEQLKEDAPIVSMLCEWAVTHKRIGSHRALVVAEFLKKRQTTLLDHGQGKRDGPIFQKILFKFLNEEAPLWKAQEGEREEFNNLILLVGELVQRKMFCYLKYLTKLISRGDLPCSKINITSQQDFTILCKELHTLPRHIQYVLSLPLPDTLKEELKQRNSLLFGTISQSMLPQQFVSILHKQLMTILSNTKLSDLANHCDVINKFRMLPAVYKYMITQQLFEPVLPPIPLNLSTTPTLPSVFQIELMYLLMELSGDVRSMIRLSMELINRFAGLKSHGVIVPLNIYLSVTAVLKKYQTCLLISEKDTEFVFDALSNVSEAGNKCSAAEKCIIAYRQELHKASHAINSKYEEPISSKYPSTKAKPKSVPNPFTTRNPSLFQAEIDDPANVDIGRMSEKLQGNESFGQAFVANVTSAVCRGIHFHSLPPLVSLCAELTANNHYLEALWIAAIHNPTQCGDIPEGPGWWSIFNAFVVLLLRQHCFSLQWLIYYVIYPSLMEMCNNQLQWPNSYHVMQIMLALFTQREFPAAENLDIAIMTHSAYRYLDAARRSLNPGMFTTMLKLLVRNGPVNIPSSHTHLAPMAVLSTICGQVWVPELCLSNPERLIDSYLLDKEVSPQKAQLLLHLICSSPSSDNPPTNPPALINHLLKKMDKWTLRSAHLEVRLIRVQSVQSQEEAPTLQMVAEAVVNTLRELVNEAPDNRHSSLWLIPTFVNKLHDTVKHNIVEWVTKWLGEGRWWESNDTFCPSTDWHQPLLDLIRTCIGSKQGPLLSMLLDQLLRFLDAKVTLDKYTEEEQEQLNVAVHFRISLVGAQFSVIAASTGGLLLDWGLLLIRLIRHPIVDPTSLGEGILFFTLLDMLAALCGPLDSVCNTNEETKETGKSVTFKRMCQEVFDLDNDVNKKVQQVIRIPLYKEELVTVEHTSTNEAWQQRQADELEIQFPELAPEGYVPVGKHYVSPWELVEGQKGGCNVAPWQELGGIKYDRQLDKMEERLAESLRGHTHDPTTRDIIHHSVVMPQPIKQQSKGPDIKSEQLPNFQQNNPNNPVQGPKPRVMRGGPMQQVPYSAIMGSPAPNVTITQQGPVPSFPPHENQYPGQPLFESQGYLGPGMPGDGGDIMLPPQQHSAMQQQYARNMMGVDGQNRIRQFMNNHKIRMQHMQHGNIQVGPQHPGPHGPPRLGLPPNMMYQQPPAYMQPQQLPGQIDPYNPGMIPVSNMIPTTLPQTTQYLQQPQYLQQQMHPGQIPGQIPTTMDQTFPTHPPQQTYYEQPYNG